MLFSAAGEGTPVVVTKTAQEAGHVLTEQDLTVVTLEGDSPIASISSTDQAIGKVLGASVAANTALTPDMVAKSPLKGGSLIGVSVKPSGMPASGLQVGDTVYISPGAGSAKTATAAAAKPAQPSSWAGTVNTVGAVREDGSRTVDVEIPTANAAAVAAVAGDGNAVLILTSPTVGK